MYMSIIRGNHRWHPMPFAVGGSWYVPSCSAASIAFPEVDFMQDVPQFVSLQFEHNPRK